MNLKLSTKLSQASIVMAALVGSSSISQGAVILNIWQDGADIRMKFDGGTLNTTALSLRDTGTPSSEAIIYFTEEHDGFFRITPNTEYTRYEGSGVSEVDTGGYVSLNRSEQYVTYVSGSRAVLMSDSSSSWFIGDSPWVSGSVIDAEILYTGQTLADRGFVEGSSRTYSWGTGATADSMTIAVNSSAPAPIPEPSGLMLASAGLGLMAFRRRRK